MDLKNQITKLLTNLDCSSQVAEEIDKICELIIKSQQDLLDRIEQATTKHPEVGLQNHTVVVNNLIVTLDTLREELESV